MLLNDIVALDDNVANDIVWQRSSNFWTTNNERETKTKGPRLHHRLGRWQAQLKSLDGTGGIGGCHPILFPRPQLVEQDQIGLNFHLEQKSFHRIYIPMEYKWVNFYLLSTNWKRRIWLPLGIPAITLAPSSTCSMKEGCLTSAT